MIHKAIRRIAQHVTVFGCLSNIETASVTLPPDLAACDFMLGDRTTRLMNQRAVQFSRWNRILVE
jgi:hypothetical protein